jgi:hypothetical protein
MSKAVPLYYFGGNFGDAIAPYLVKKITGRGSIRLSSSIWGRPSTDRMKQPFGYMIIGSVCALAGPKQAVWGCGVMYPNRKVHGGKFYAVRGPLSRIALEAQGFKVPEVFGDPALLLPRFYDKPVEVEHEIGFIPHFINQKDCADRFPGTFQIDLMGHNPGKNYTASIESTIDKIRSCKRVVSSSLHGVIVAHAYGIPAVWATFSKGEKQLHGGKWRFFKFQDYYLSVGMLPPKAPVDLSDLSVTVEDLIAMCPKSVDLDIDLDKLLAACPIPKADSVE